MSPSPRSACTAPRERLRRALAAAVLLGGLVACGGGGGGGGSDGGGVVVPPPPVDTGPDLRGLSCSVGEGSGWCWQKPQPQGLVVRDVVFADALRGWAAADAGRVLRTVDGGRNWTIQDTGRGSDFAVTSLAFADADTGWAVGSAWPDVLRTVDGGRTWSAVTPAPMQVASSVQWLGARRLLVRGFNGYRLNAPTAAISEDGGTTWREARFDFAQADGTLWSGDARSSDFGRSFVRAPGWRAGVTGAVVGGNDGIVWARGSEGTAGWIGVSGDGGQTFTWSSAELPPSFGTALLDSLSFFPAGRGWALALPPTAASPQTLLSTADWGGQWTRVAWPAGVVPDSLLRSFFVDGRTVLLSRGPGRWITRDGGASWSVPALPPEAGEIVAVRRDATARLLLRDDADRWFREGDAAGTWQAVVPALPAAPAQRGLWFFDRQRGLALADDGALLATADAGRSWALRTRLGGSAPEPAWLNFLPSRAGGLQFRGGNGWLVDGDRRLRRSTDGGATWVAIGVGNSIDEFVRGVQFIDAQSGFATTLQCEEGRPASCVMWLHLTINAGGSWQRLPLPLGGASSLVAFADLQRGVRMNDVDGRMYFTTDGGRQWQPATDALANGGMPNRVVMSSDGTGWLLGNDGVRRTRDFGRSWQAVDIVLPPVNSVGIYLPLPQDIAFGDAQNGWIVATNGVVMATRDGGATWRRQPTGTQVALTTLFALDGQRAWIGGERGVLLGTVTGGQ